MPEIFIGIGSNIDPESHIRAAVRGLRARFGTLQVSPVYRNPAVGFVGDDFLNLAVGFHSEEPVSAVRAALDEIETRCGRVRGSPRFAPRTLDLDLLLYGELVTETPLRLPRAEILQHAYVLKPLADLAGARRHPLTGRLLAEHWREFGNQDCELVEVRLGDL